MAKDYGSVSGVDELAEINDFTFGYKKRVVAAETHDIEGAKNIVTGRNIECEELNGCGTLGDGRMNTVVAPTIACNCLLLKVVLVNYDAKLRVVPCPFDGNAENHHCTITSGTGGRR